jgi:hypothetical protein
MFLASVYSRNIAGPWFFIEDAHWHPSLLPKLPCTAGIVIQMFKMWLGIDGSGDKKRVPAVTTSDADTSTHITISAHCILCKTVLGKILDLVSTNVSFFSHGELQ